MTYLSKIQKQEKLSNVCGLKFKSQGGDTVDVSLEWGGAKSKAKVHLRGDWKQVQEGGERRGGDWNGIFNSNIR